MQVILFQPIEKLGLQGDVVNVAPGYYRNYLGPRGIAIEATAGNLKRLELKRKKLKAEAEKQVAGAREFAGRLNGTALEFIMKATSGNRLFGSIHDHEIAEELKKQGFDISRRQVLLSEPLKTVGKHDVKIRLLGNVEAHIFVTITPEGGMQEEDEPVRRQAAPAPAEGEGEAAQAEDAAAEATDE